MSRVEPGRNARAISPGLPVKLARFNQLESSSDTDNHFFDMGESCGGLSSLNRAI